MKKIAIIGSGIAGVSAAYYLKKLGYEVSLFEAGAYFGGHTNTVEVELDNKKIPVDTGFLVHNDRTYPNLISFFKELNIKSHPSDMTFSVERTSEKIIWAGTNLFTVFAQIKNLFSPRFYKFLYEVLKFNKNSKIYFEESKLDISLTLGQLLERKNYGENFKNWYLLPMGGCIWSTPTQEMLNFPAYTFLLFCMNHGLLQIFDRPQWKTVIGGCRTYVAKALANIENKYLNEPVKSVERVDGKIKIVSESREEIFDYCILCSHPPESIKMLKDLPSEVMRILTNFKYQKNKAVLHIDESILPPIRGAWAAWNYLSIKKNDEINDSVSVSYLINKLQPVPTEKSIIVTLNPVYIINRDLILKEISYEHPLFNVEAIISQEAISKIQGQGGIYFAGAWMRYGFHEDGILSAKNAIKQLLIDDKSSQTIEIL